MTYFYVTRQAGDGFVAMLSLGEIRTRLAAGELKESFFATESDGRSFSEFRKRGNGTWRTLAALLAEYPIGEELPAQDQARPTRRLAQEEHPGTDHPVAGVLVIVFRVLAVVVALLYTVLFTMTLQAPSQAEEAARKLGRMVDVPVGAALVRVVLEAVLVVSLLLAVAELLRLGMALERNTRSRGNAL
jgi:hypothetical protein